MNRSWMKWGALGCCGLALILFLALPMISAYGFTDSSLCGWNFLFNNPGALMVTTILNLICVIAMFVSVLAAQAKTAGIICCVGAVLPLIITLIGGSQYHLSPSTGIYMILLLGGGAATLCFLSCGRGYRPYQDQYNNQYNDRNNNQSGGNQW